MNKINYQMYIWACENLVMKMRQLSVLFLECLLLSVLLISCRSGNMDKEASRILQEIKSSELPDTEKFERIDEAIETARSNQEFELVYELYLEKARMSSFADAIEIYEQASVLALEVQMIDKAALAINLKGIMSRRLRKFDEAESFH